MSRANVPEHHRVAEPVLPHPAPASPEPARVCVPGRLRVRPCLHLALSSAGMTWPRAAVRRRGALCEADRLARLSSRGWLPEPCRRPHPSDFLATSRNSASLILLGRYGLPQLVLRFHAVGASSVHQLW